MTKETAEKIWNSYLVAYSPVATADRERLLRETVSNDVLAANPGEEMQGLDVLIDHVEKFQQRLPGSYFKLNSLKFHHEQALAELTLYKADDSAMGIAYTYAVFNDQGRMKKLIGFF